MALAIMAAAFSVALLTSDMRIPMPREVPAHVISAAPLLLIGISFLIFQPVLRPPGTILLKNAVLAAAFILWGVVQLMERNALSKRLGNVVIVLYVLDLAWVILARASLSRAIRPAGKSFE
jgi:hypothetical protein